ncbi:MAG TPA: hypothetical protein VFZ81_10140 [Burkholderiales bacterium]
MDADLRPRRKNDPRSAVKAVRARSILQRAAACLAALALAACLGPPQRDVFAPPYAEKGCWARLYGKAGFEEPVRQLEGPVFVESVGEWMAIVPDIESAPPQPLFSEVRSAQVGPHARLEGYAEPLFRRPSLALGPGEQLADIALSEHVQSFTLRCEA